EYHDVDAAQRQDREDTRRGGLRQALPHGIEPVPAQSIEVGKDAEALTRALQVPADDVSDALHDSTPPASRILGRRSARVPHPYRQSLLSRSPDAHLPRSPVPSAAHPAAAMMKFRHYSARRHQALHEDEDFLLLTWDSCRYDACA